MLCLLIDCASAESTQSNRIRSVIKRLLRILAGAVLSAALLLAILPGFMSTRQGRNTCVSLANRFVPGKFLALCRLQSTTKPTPPECGVNDQMDLDCRHSPGGRRASWLAQAGRHHRPDLDRARGVRWSPTCLSGAGQNHKGLARHRPRCRSIYYVTVLSLPKVITAVTVRISSQQLT